VASFELGGFILDAQIGDGNLAVDELESVFLCDFAFADFVVAIRAEESEIPIEILFEFVVENDPDRSASGLFNACGLLLIQAIEIGIVFEFERFKRRWPVFVSVTTRSDFFCEIPTLLSVSKPCFRRWRMSLSIRVSSPR
jgi:hypothetical protein